MRFTKSLVESFLVLDYYLVNVCGLNGFNSSFQPSSAGMRFSPSSESLPISSPSNRKSETLLKLLLSGLR